MFEGLLLMDKLLCAPFPSEQNSEVRRHILYQVDKFYHFIHYKHDNFEQTGPKNRHTSNRAHVLSTKSGPLLHPRRSISEQMLL